MTHTFHVPGFRVFSASETSKLIQPLQCHVIGARRRCGTGRLHEQMETKEGLELRGQDGFYSVALPR